MVAEQFRIIRSNLQYVINKKDKAVILTTSFSGEGKSYVSTNMGAVWLAQVRRLLYWNLIYVNLKFYQGWVLPKDRVLPTFGRQNK